MSPELHAGTYPRRISSDANAAHQAILASTHSLNEPQSRPVAWLQAILLRIWIVIDPDLRTVANNRLAIAAAGRTVRYVACMTACAASRLNVSGLAFPVRKTTGILRASSARWPIAAICKAASVNCRCVRPWPPLLALAICFIPARGDSGIFHRLRGGKGPEKSVSCAHWCTALRLRIIPNRNESAASPRLAGKRAR
jgi:hypothetical protein